MVLLGNRRKKILHDIVIKTAETPKMVFRMYSWFGNIYKQPLQGMPSLFSLKHALEKSFLAWHSQFCLFEMVHTFFPVINPLTSCTENDPLVDDIKTLHFALSIAKVIKARLSF